MSSIWSRVTGADVKRREKKGPSGQTAGAVFVGLAVKMQLVLGFLRQDDSLQRTRLLLAGMLAGVSERLVPNLAADMAGKAAREQAKDVSIPPTERRYASHGGASPS